MADTDEKLNQEKLTQGKVTPPQRDEEKAPSQHDSVEAKEGASQEPGADSVEAEAGKEQAEPSATWVCETRVNDVEPIADLENLYVGDKYLLHCKGDVVLGFESAKAKLAFASEPQEYSVKILEFRTFTEKDFWAEATSYKPGEHSFEGVSLRDGKQVIALSSTAPIKVKSILAEKPKQEAMNPAAKQIIMLGPFPLSLPMWIWISIGLASVLFIGVVWRIVYKRLQKRRLIEELSKHATALSAHNQFHKEIRQHIRKYTGPTAQTKSVSAFLKDIDTSFRMYLVREFLIPAMEWGTSSIMGELKSQHRRTYRYAGPQVRKLLVEFERAKVAGDKNALDDCEQMIEMSRRVVDQIQKLRRVQK